MVSTTPDTPSVPKRRISRRRLIVLSIVTFFLIGGWQVVERFIDIERYRPLIDTELEKLIKLPLSFGAMDLRLFPTPHLVVEDVTAGEGDFSAFSPEISVTAGLGSLLRGHLALTHLSIAEARLQMPEGREAFRLRWREYLRSLSAPRESSGKSRMKVTLDNIDVPVVQIFIGAQPFSSGSLEVLGVTAGAPEFVFDLQGSSEGNEMTARGNLVLALKQDPRIQGAAHLGGIALSDLTGDPTLPPFLLDAETTFAVARDNSIAVEADGQVRVSDQADALGPFEVSVRQSAESLRLEGLRVNTAPVVLEATLELFDDKRWNLAVATATLRNQGIEWLVARVPGIPMTVPEGESAEVGLQQARLAGGPTQGFSFAEGAIEVSGVGIRMNDGYTIDRVRGSVTVQNDRYQLTDFSNENVETAGTMTVDYLTDTVSLDLTGTLKLGPEFPLPDALAKVLRTEAGTVTIPEFKATFQNGNVQLSTLRIAAKIEAGVVSMFDRRTNAFASATGADGEISFSDGALRISRMAGPYTEFSGTLTPDERLQRWAVSFAFSSDLSSPLWKFLQPAAVNIQAGKLKCTRLEAVYLRGQSAPEALLVEAIASDVKLAIQNGGFKDVVRLSSVALSTSGEAVAYEAQGSTGTLGPFTAKGSYAVATGSVDSEARIKLAEAKELPESWRDGPAGSLFKALGEVPLKIRYDATEHALTISSEDLSLAGTMDFVTDGKAKAPFDLSASAVLPASWLAPHLSTTVEPAGSLAVNAKMAASDGKFIARADFANAVLVWSFLEKKAGFPLAVSADGHWSGGRARIDAGQVDAGGEIAAFTVKDGAVRTDHFAIALEPLSPLLPEGSSMSGRLSGTYAGDTGTVALNFDDVTGTIAADMSPVRLDGGIARHGGAWRVENLAWVIGSSQGSLQASAGGGKWQGRVDSSQIHVTELKAFHQAWKARLGVPENPTQPPWNFTGDFEVTAGTLQWAEATMVNARSMLHFTPGALEAADLAIGHGSGTITGAIGYASAREGNPAVITTNLLVQGVDAVLLEGLFLEKARGLAGPMNGQVALTIPLIPDSPSVLHAMSGDVTFEAKDGTLGKAGLASKLLAALRTTDILRLRVPQLKDNGLSYKTLTGRVAIENGVFRADPFRLSDSAYVLDVRATFDYPADTAEGRGELQVLQGVTGLARKIPILGDAANLVSKVLGIPIKVSGTAKDPTFGVGVPGPVHTPAKP